MFFRGLLMAVLTLGVLPASTLRADKPATRPTTSPADKRARKLAKLIGVVTNAKEPSSAAAAYARANAIDSCNVKLHETYMFRMLKFGLPKIAVYPARVLVTLKRDHAPAWSVIGYMHGRRRQTG